MGEQKKKLLINTLLYLIIRRRSKFEEGNGNPLLPGESPWTEEPGGLQSMGSQESDMTKRLNHHHHYYL